MRQKISTIHNTERKLIINLKIFEKCFGAIIIQNLTFSTVLIVVKVQLLLICESNLCDVRHTPQFVEKRKTFVFLCYDKRYQTVWNYTKLQKSFLDDLFYTSTWEWKVWSDIWCQYPSITFLYIFLTLYQPFILYSKWH